jgi:hypothetical protein
MDQGCALAPWGWLLGASLLLGLLGVSPWGRAAVTGQYDSDWFQKRAQFWGYNDVFGAKKKVIGITCGQSQETLHRWAGLASHA